MVTAISRTGVSARWRAPEAGTAIERRTKGQRGGGLREQHDYSAYTVIFHLRLRQGSGGPP